MKIEREVGGHLLRLPRDARLFATRSLASPSIRRYAVIFLDAATDAVVEFTKPLDFDVADNLKREFNRLWGGKPWH